MKKALLLLLALFTLCAPAQADGPPRDTADFYTLRPERYENKNVTLYVAYTMQWKYEGPSIPDGFRPLTLFTSYQGERGGYINALVSDDKYAKIVRDYGSKPRYDGSNKIKSDRLTCLFYKWKDKSGGVEWVVVVK